MADNIFRTGMFIQQTSNYEIGRLQAADVKSEEFKEILVRQYRYTGDIAEILNQKTSGQYVLTQFVSGNQWFKNPATPVDNSQLRMEYRKVINFGPLPAAGTRSVPHGITVTSNTTFVHIYGTANDTTGLTYLPLPYASPVLAQNIALNVDATNVNITVGMNRSNYNIVTVVLLYLQY